MIVLVSGATATLRKIRSKHLGVLVEPKSPNRVKHIREINSVWAMDNGCFKGLDKPQFIKMLKYQQDLPGCQFVVAPDVLGCAWETLLRFNVWYPVIRHYGYPVAFVGQDGLEFMADRIPWDKIDAFFIGGSTRWKLGAAAATIAQKAKSMGKWVHMGRVNSRKRARYAQYIGCDSIDGTSFSIAPEESIAGIMPTLVNEQLALF